MGAAEKQGIKKGMTQGFFTGYMWFIIFLSYALAFWYGSTLIFADGSTFTPGKMMTVLLKLNSKNTFLT